MNIKDQFILACENGDYNQVHRILEENPKFSIDVTNRLGRTAIQLAIEKEHLEVTKEKTFQWQESKFLFSGRRFTSESV